MTPRNSATTLEKESCQKGESPLMNAEELGRYLRLTDSPKPGAGASAVNQRIHRKRPMPPEVRLTGTKRRLWHREQVNRWLEHGYAGGVGEKRDSRETDPRGTCP